MNKRIRELLDRAQESYSYSDADGDNNRGTRLNEEKFAQSIVQECTNIVLHYTDVDEGVAVAKKHFGVDE